MITILLVDDQRIVRQGWRMQLGLEPDLAIVGEAETGEEAVRLATELNPDVILMDIQMPVMDGLTAARRLHTAMPACGVILLSLHDGPEVRGEAQAAGAIAFVSKGEPADRLVALIREAAKRHS